MRLLLALVLVILIGACGNGDDGPAASSTDSPTSTSTAEERLDLEDLVVATPPRTFEPVPEELPGGPFDLKSFLEDYSIADDEDRRLLTSCGFTRGFQRAWVSEAAELLLGVFVFECRSGSAASALLEGFAEQDRRLKDATPVEAQSIPESEGRTYLETTTAGKARVDLVTFVRNERLYVVQSQSASEESDQAPLLELAKEQAALAR